MATPVHTAPARTRRSESAASSPRPAAFRGPQVPQDATTRVSSSVTKVRSQATGPTNEAAHGWASRIVGEADVDPNERWAAVRGFDGAYEVSTQGRVRRIGHARGAQPGRIIAATTQSAGYLVANLQMRGAFPKLIHRLVADAFINEIKPGFEVNHKNGNKHDNRLENLEIVTRTENIHHAQAMGLMKLSGENNPATKITSSIARAVKDAYAAGDGGYKKLGARFGLRWGHVRDIVKGVLWATA